MNPEEPKRYPHEAAVEVAKEILHSLLPLCATVPGDPKPRVRIVGSVRRLKPMVKDLEILFIPAIVKEPDPGDMFGATREVIATDAFFANALSSGLLHKRTKADGTTTWGAEIRLAVHVPTGIPVDFFTATPENWWNLMVCRTGGYETNIRIASEAKARGWKWKPNGPGFLRPDNYWLLVKSERDVFRALGMEYLEPHERA